MARFWKVNKQQRNHPKKEKKRKKEKETPGTKFCLI